MGNHKSAILFDAKEDRTKQSFQKDCDINAIMERYLKTGKLPDLIRDNPRFGDFTTVPDYQKALEIVATAEQQFASLPAKVRDRFQNMAEKFLEFVADPKNEKELVEMGLAKEKPKPTPEAPVVPEKPEAPVVPAGNK